MTFEVQKLDEFPNEQFKALKNDALRTYHPFLAWRDSLDEKQTEKLGALKTFNKDAWSLKLGVIHKGELIAASFTMQSTATEAMMMISVVRPDFRGQGVYTALCKRVLDETKAAGFQSVHSKHMMTNNPILIAKLKLGFKIAGMEVHSVHGTLLNLVYNHNELMAKAQRYRSGELFLFTDDEIYENFGQEVP